MRWAGCRAPARRGRAGGRTRPTRRRCAAQHGPDGRGPPAGAAARRGRGRRRRTRRRPRARAGRRRAGPPTLGARRRDPGDRGVQVHRDAERPAALQQRVAQAAQAPAHPPRPEALLDVRRHRQHRRGAARVRARVGGVPVQPHAQPRVRKERSPSPRSVSHGATTRRSRRRALNRARSRARRGRCRTGSPTRSHSRAERSCSACHAAPDPGPSAASSAAGTAAGSNGRSSRVPSANR